MHHSNFSEKRKYPDVSNNLEKTDSYSNSSWSGVISAGMKLKIKQKLTLKAEYNISP